MSTNVAVSADYRASLGDLKARSTQPAIAKQGASQLLAIPSWNNVVIMAKYPSHTEALYDVQQPQPHGWSRAVLIHQL